MIADALGHPVSDLCEEDQRLLSVLLDSDLHESIGYDTDFESILETVSDWGSDDSWYGVTQVGEMLWGHHERQKEGDHSAPGTMDFTIHHQPESYDTPMYSVGYHLGADVDSYLTMTSDGKYLSSRDSSGLRAALHTAGVIEGDYQRQRSKAIRLGLVPNPEAPQPDPASARGAIEFFERALEGDSGDAEIEAAHDMRDALQAYIDHDTAQRTAPKPSPWPTNDFERSVYDDWKYEVTNGDDASSFRDWFASRYPKGGRTVSED